MSNERTLSESQGAGGGRSGHGEAQLPGRQPPTEEGKAVKGTGPAQGAAPAEHVGWGREVCINHNVLWAKAAQTTEQRQNMMKKAPLPAGSVQVCFLEGEINGSYHHRKLRT